MSVPECKINPPQRGLPTTPPQTTTLAQKVATKAIQTGTYYFITRRLPGDKQAYKLRITYHQGNERKTFFAYLKKDDSWYINPKNSGKQTHKTHTQRVNERTSLYTFLEKNKQSTE